MLVEVARHHVVDSFADVDGVVGDPLVVPADECELTARWIASSWSALIGEDRAEQLAG